MLGFAAGLPTQQLRVGRREDFALPTGDPSECAAGDTGDDLDEQVDGVMRKGIVVAGTLTCATRWCHHDGAMDGLTTLDGWQSWHRLASGQRAQGVGRKANPHDKLS